tara:strand:- start:1482 stop:1766 length:285 start_codon:yes stop_codon:yes gene_type:complete
MSEAVAIKDVGRLEEEITTMVQDEFSLNESELTSNLKLFTSGLLTSLDMIDLSVLIEERYGIRIEDSDLSLENLDSIGAISSFLVNQMNPDSGN